MSSPCHHCDKRVLGCHAECEDYKAFAEWARAKNEKIRQQKRSEAYYRSVPHDMASSKYHL